MQSLNHVRRASRTFLLKQKGVLRRIHKIRDGIRDVSDGVLQSDMSAIRERAVCENDLDKLLPEVFAYVCEAVFRVYGFDLHDEQLVAGIALHKGWMAEQATGEGKSLSVVAPACLNALLGRGVHIVTVNDYLASRDAVDVGEVFVLLGISCGCVLNRMDPLQKKQEYLCDVTYVTNSELGFDYLRDNMALSMDARVQRPLSYAIVDEADSVFIDEAKTPLIISGEAESPMDLYQMCDMAVRELARGDAKELTKLDVLYGNHPEESGDYIVMEKEKTVRLTEAGVRKIERFFGLSNFSDASHLDLQHHIQMALRAHALFHRDQEYVVLDGEVQIVDTFTGRVLPGRRYSDGLHQAIEAKEHVTIKNESRTLATITYQSFFTKYPKLAGMTGTAATEAQEFLDIYGLRTVVVPTHQPIIREDLDDAVYLTKQAKYRAIADAVAECYFGNGQPVLLGTPNIEVSETLSMELFDRGIPHEVLNAKQNAHEAEIIAKAGELHTVTIATNMAGRGTDIKLTDESRKAGGLFVIGSERHEARRIDQQLRGRSGRQGDPGKSRFYLSLEDEVMRLFAPERMLALFRGMGVSEDEAIVHRSLTNTIRKAQMKIEGNNFGIRRRLMDYEDVNNRQRELVYRQRDLILRGCNLHGIVMDMLDSLAVWLDDFHRVDPDGAVRESVRIFGRECTFVDAGDSVLQLCMLFHTWYQARVSGFEHAAFDRLVQRTMLSVTDRYWMRHLDHLELLKQDVSLIGYGQKDPAVAYRIAAYEAFDRMLLEIQKETVRLLFKAVLVRTDSSGEVSDRAYIPADRGETVSLKARQSVIGGEPSCTENEEGMAGIQAL